MGGPGRYALDLLRCAHLRAAIGVTVVGFLLALAAGLGPSRLLLATAAVATGQLSIGWSNDWRDRHRDRRSGRTDKPLTTGALPALVVGVAAVIAAIGCITLSLALGVVPGVLHLTAVAAGWAYNFGLKATVASVVPYAVAFGLLPAFIVAAAPGQPTAPYWLVLSGALLGSGAHFVDVIPDLDDDLATGIRGLPHRIGAGPAGATGAVLLLTATAVLAFGRPGPPGVTGWLALALAVPAAGAAAAAGLGRSEFRRKAFAAVVVLAVLDTFLLVLGGASLS
ncbi:MAG: UbiA family prenyltransferase [Geodermatophilaceae bacterium]|nr:UbiA family prenyltransferase [Geodermatophilaceae bacterium]